MKCFDVKDRQDAFFTACGILLALVFLMMAIVLSVETVRLFMEWCGK